QGRRLDPGFPLVVGSRLELGPGLPDVGEAPRDGIAQPCAARRRDVPGVVAAAVALRLAADARPPRYLGAASAGGVAVDVDEDVVLFQELDELAALRRRGHVE